MKKIDSIIEILIKDNSALHYSDITIKYNDIYKSKLTPKHINSFISRDISKHQKSSTFVRLSPGYYGLRKWLDEKDKRYKEYSFKREKTDYLDEYIAVIDSELLSGFIKTAGVIEKVIDSVGLSNACRSMHRRKAEKTKSVIQLVSVFLLCHKKKILTFTRTKALPEKRLRNTISINFGGHISYHEASDAFNQFDINDQHSWISRELHEEISITNKFTVNPIGYIYDNTTDFGIQHLGLLHFIDLPDNKSFSISEKSFFINPSFKTIEEVRKNNEPDFWTDSLLKFLDDYLFRD